ncbi:YceI family protein [Paenibacillus xerothermodurans]|uniref:Polyisoprenoid-binding protein n=1 Tax=Paenibacillus xerothermodurans TaxID=1977292 RepID=A0A2W1NC91_PAEXE|nr:YceI family protein [Paenibacillus xerothermodurans]PZE22309.1 polyisoprenoid-binding protein [Paenibacillus xerothermodurans]
MTKTKWSVDPTHSSIDFTIRHMMIAKVKGTFHNFAAEIDADPEDLTTAQVQFTIDLNSIDTRNKERDDHLRTADFFDVQQHPALVFRSTSIVTTGDGEYDVTGEVSLHGVTRSETFSVVYEGAGIDPWGNAKVGFSGQGSIKRSDYGLTYNAALETGGVLIGDEVKIDIEIEAAKQS